MKYNRDDKFLPSFYVGLGVRKDPINMHEKSFDGVIIKRLVFVYKEEKFLSHCIVLLVLKNLYELKTKKGKKYSFFKNNLHFFFFLSRKIKVYTLKIINKTSYKNLIHLR